MLSSGTVCGDDDRSAHQCRRQVFCASAIWGTTSSIRARMCRWRATLTNAKKGSGRGVRLSTARPVGEGSREVQNGRIKVPDGGVNLLVVGRKRSTKSRTPTVSTALQALADTPPSAERLQDQLLLRRPVFRLTSPASVAAAGLPPQVSLVPAADCNQGSR